jgi:hypothetical protein
VTRAALAVLIAALAGAGRAEAQEQVGNKMLGTLGLRAGSVPKAGLSLVGQFFSYSADRVVDRNGRTLPIDLDLDARVGTFGAGASFEVRPIRTFIGASVGIPLVRVSTTTSRSEGSVDRIGLSDLYVQPVKLGWKLGRVEMVAAYAFYAPTGQFEPGGKDGVGRGNFTHEPSIGGTVYFDSEKKWNASALASLDVNDRKRHIDITRGATLQVQGGLGTTVGGFVEAGLVGYALWQVTDDRGSDLPAALRGARDQDYGLGPEVDVSLRAIRSRLTLRYERDLVVRSRPEGQIILLGLQVLAWAPPS